MACPECGHERRHADGCSGQRKPQLWRGPSASRPRPPKSSWWVALTRAEFRARQAQEGKRMRSGGTGGGQVLDG